VASVITTTPRAPHGFFRPKPLVAGLIVLALLAVLCVSLLWEATVPGPTAATAPQSSPAPPRPALAPAEEAYAQALWAIHADVKRAAYDLTFSGLRLSLVHAQYLDAVQLFQRSAAEMLKVTVDGRDEHLLAAHPLSQKASEEILRVGDTIWPGEYLPN